MALGVVLVALVELAAADILSIPNLSAVATQESSGGDVGGGHRLDVPGWTIDLGIPGAFGEIDASEWDVLIRDYVIADGPTDDLEHGPGLKLGSLEGAAFLGSPLWEHGVSFDEFSESGLITDPTQKLVGVEIRVDSFGKDAGLGSGPAAAHSLNPSRVTGGVTTNVGMITQSLATRAPASRGHAMLGTGLAERYYLDWPWSTRPGRNMFAWIIGPPAIIFLAVVVMVVFYKASRGSTG